MTIQRKDRFHGKHSWVSIEKKNKYHEIIWGGRMW